MRATHPCTTISALLIDIDGVLYTGTTPVPGAIETVEALHSQGIPHRYISNSTRRSRKSIAIRLQGMGFPVLQEEILTPAIAAARFLADEKITRTVFVTTQDVLKDFSAAGFVSVPERADAVVVGDAGTAFTYDLLNAAFRSVMQGARILALEKDRYWMDTDGLALAAGPFVAALEFATGKEALVIGKPSPSFFRLALAELGAEAHMTAMIGDDIETDIGGAMRCGLQGVLVRTGKYREETLLRSGVHPTYIIDSLHSALDLF